MILLIILSLKYLFNKKNNFLLKIDNFEESTQNVEISKLIYKIKNNKIKNILITSDYKKILFEKNKKNDNKQLTYKKYYSSNIEPIIINKIIDECVDNDVNFSFIKYIKNNIIQSILKDFNFLYNNFIVPFIYLVIFLYVCSLGYYALNLLYEDSHNLNNIFGNGISGRLSNNNNLLNNNKITNLTIQQKGNNKYLNQINSFDPIKENISLSSWVGSPEVFEECFEVISYIKNISNYERFGVKLPKGILLEGPPGVGKTHLAKAIASETSSTFIPVTGSEFIEVYVGVGASRVRNLFESARENSPSIIFIDEIDAIGKKRNGGFGGGSDERDQTLNQLLAEMDGFKDNEGILILAATNRKEILDKALLRPGRFDRIIKIGYPDKYSREKIIKLYLEKKKYISKSINSSTIADLTEGFSGAELQNLINEAAILAARRNAKKIMPKDILDSIEKNIVGIIKNIDTRTPETKFRISVHEVGHAFLVLYYSEYFDLLKISIKSTYNGAGGYTLFNDKIEFKNDGLYTKDILKKRLIVSMGGKAAESIWYGNDKVSLGSTQDLKQANQLARKMIGLFGMGDGLEAFYNQDVGEEFELYGLSQSNKYSEKIKEKFDIETLNLVSESFLEAKKIISNYKYIIEELSIFLMEKEILNLSDLPNHIVNFNK